MNLLITGAFQYKDSQIEELEKLGYELFFHLNEKEIIKIDVSEIDVVICNNLFLHNEISEFTRLKAIQLTSTGFENIPMKYIENCGIKLYNAEDVYSIPIAEWVLHKILEIYKSSKTFYKQQNEMKWLKQREIIELSGKTASIIGYGNIGKHVAKRLKAFDVHVIGVGRTERKFSDIEYYLMQELDNVLKQSDIVVIALPLNQETLHLIDKFKLEKMKENAVVINVSRGKVIDEIALIKQLQNGKFLGVALDVFEEEPLPRENPLWEIERVHITPHNSFVSDNNNNRLFNKIINNLSQIINSNI